MTTLGHGQAQCFGAGVEFAVFGGQQQAIERMLHGQCPPVSTPDAASTRTIAMAAHMTA